LLADLQREFRLSYIFIAHDLAVVRQIATRVAVMYLGNIVELAETAALFAEPRHPYTQALLSAVPVPDPAARRKRIILEGDVRGPLPPPPGCRSPPRCPHARAGGREEVPALVAEARGRAVACHFWREIQAPAVTPERMADDAVLAKLQAAFANNRSIQT